MKIADISHYQGKIDWTTAAKELDFCILRASIGEKNDTRFDEYAQGCRDNGISFGAYHYLKATTSYDATREAEWFWKQANPEHPLFYVLDCEYGSITKEEKAEPGSAREIVNDFLETLRKLAGKSIIVGCYIGHHLYKSWGLDYAAFDFVWIPRYGTNSGSPETKPAYPCDIWQFTSNGRLAGVKGRVDLNKLTGRKPLSFFTERPAVATPSAEPTQPTTTQGGSDTMFTNLELAAFAISVYAAKWVYWYGTCGYKCSTSLYNSKSKQYPSHYTSARASGYKVDISNAKMCADCVGLIKAFFWLGGKLDGKNKYGSNGCPDKSATGMFELCKESGPISTIPDIPGLVVWKEGHIGVYVGGGYTIEMQGFANDCIKRKTTAGPWTKWGKLPASMLTYEGGDVPQPIVYKLGDRTLQKGDEGEDVAELQAALKALGYDLGTYGAERNGIDGDFGSKTQAAVSSVQAAAGLAQTGVFDGSAYKALLDAKNPATDPLADPPADTPQEPDTDTPDDGSAPAYVLILEGDEAALRAIRRDHGGTLAEVDSITVG